MSGFGLIVFGLGSFAFGVAVGTAVCAMSRWGRDG